MLTRSIGVTLAVTSLAVAHSHHGLRMHRDINANLHARQGPSASVSHPASASASHGASASNPAPTPSGTTPSVPAVTAAGAMPLDQIGPQGVQPADQQFPTFAAGAKPSGLANAPALPDISGWNGAKYPTPDKVPPTDTAEVIGWINEVRNSGVLIPDIAPHANQAGASLCQIPANMPRVGNTTECWWSCGHCSRKSDIVECKQKKMWGSSFDDGPTTRSAKLVNYLEKEKLKTTFFVIGSRVAGLPNGLRAEYLLGHQIGVHGWSHTPMTTQSSEQLIAEFGWTKKVIKDAIGVTPLYFRPPYGDIDDRVRAIARAMNLTPVMWTSTGTEAAPIVFDTNDGLVVEGKKTAAQSLVDFQSLLQVADTYRSGFIVLEHDLFWQQVELAVGYFLPTAVARGYQVVSIGQCMSQELADTYAETNTKNILPPGNGLGSDMTAVNVKAPANAPLGGSDGSNTDPTKPAGAGKDGGKDDAAGSLLFSGVPSLVAGVVLSALFVGAPVLF